ncbi:MAG: SapC family protein [Cohaesibacter sp.]|nr:SapC family protein [Cohaesibacter sp.]
MNKMSAATAQAADEIDRENKKPSRDSALYRRVERLNGEQHNALRMLPMERMDFATSLNSIVLTVSEFSSAARDYPIVFAQSNDKIMPYAITGYKQGENVYVDEEGHWRPNHYIPAFLRRYPFIFMENDQGTGFSLCLDMDCPFLSTESGEPLYEKGQPSALIEKAMEFSKAFQTEAEKTAAFCAQLKALDLFITQNARFKMSQEAGGEEVVVAGFMVIDEKKLNTLSDDVFVDLRKTRALGLIYSHLVSMGSWADVVS